jgi:DhnA family fructose-bisphosphate aldolase class Ia
VISVVGIASAIGATSAHTWLKLPVLADMGRVAASTTLPILLLGGEVADDQDAAFASWEAALSLPGVYGLVVGRSLLFPPDDDLEAALDSATAMLERAGRHPGKASP